MEFNAPATENLFDRAKLVGKSTPRIDGPLKVSGAAPYAAERHDVAAGQAYGWIVGAAIAKRDGARWVDKPEADWLPEMRAFAIATLMAEIKTDLETLGVNIDVYSSERALVESGAVDRAFQELSRQDLIYQGQLEPPKGKKPDDWEDREQTLFRATQFGDEVDRPLK